MKERQRMIDEAIRYQKEHGFTYWTPVSAADFALVMLGDQKPATDVVEVRRGK